MKTTKALKKRILSIALSVALLLSVVPFGAFSVAAATPDYYKRVADDSTMDNWKKYFDLDNLDTVNAGGVGADKSVFTDTSAFPASITMQDKDRNFLTAMSAIAANKEIVGYSSIPTDTVLVLDLSGSMTSAQAEDDLVNAANDAITRLLSINENNRVGVVLYSASSTAGTSTYSESVTRLLPIDRYTTAADGKYLNLRYEEMEFNNNERDYGIVSVDRDVVGEKTAANALTKEKVFVGGTYIQAGLWEAKEMFEEMDTQIGDNNWQSGDDRMPILVLMSDGAPSTGTSYYDDVINSQYTTGSGWNQRTVYESNVGNGSEENLRAGNAFLTQLTASYVMNRIEAHYQQKDANVRGLFYTLGFNIGDNSIAQSVMNPDASTATDTLWSTYNSLTGGSMPVTVKGRSSSSSSNNTLSVSVAKNSYVTNKSYVDQYFSASDDGLTDAFDAIVEEIILQSRYYPTHLAGGNPDFSGYVEFTDEIGEYMEVKRINGILLGNTLFDGHMMASKLADNSEDGLGTPARPTALGDEFIRAVKTRLGIAETADAQALVAKAYADKQLYYTDANNWSNYIAWYAKADGTYAGFYDEDGTEAKPADAVYINRSYGFLGETVGSIKNSDMMYMSVQVRTNIETGKQTVSWKIPASLVPMVTYKVSLTGTNVDTATNVQLTLADENVAPIRLVYETGLRSDLNAFNITRITETEADAKSDEAHVADDGYTRLFWNNAFDISANDHEHHKTAMAEFTPNKENERFYYTFDSAVHKKVGDSYVLVDDSEPLDENGKLNKNSEYYHRRYTFKEGVLTPIFTYEKMSAASISAAVWDATFETLDHQTGAWVVAEGTPARELKMYGEEKATNVTDSAHMIFYPYLTEQNNTYYVDMNLGNNGRLAVTPAQGIKLSKTIDVYEAGTSTDFAFRVTVHNANGTPYTGSADSYVTALDVTPSGTPTSVTFSAQGTHVFDLAADETLWLAGLPTGAVYTVEEVSTNSDYKVKSVHVNGQATGNIAAGTVAAYYIDDVDFVNTVIGEGHLVITKQVVDANGNPVDIADSVTFTAEVTLTDANGAPVSGTFDSSNGTLTVPANGKFTVTLKEGESFIVRKISEETRYTVTETNIPAGFALDTAKSVLNGVVDASANDQALIVNTYEPTDATGQGVQVKVTKQITGNRTAWVAGESYTFRLERLGNNAAVLDTATIAAGDTVKEHLFSLANEVYGTAGTYYYRLTEVVGTQGGITYDTAERRFSVEVADADKNGTFEIVAVNNEMNTAVSGNWLVTADFNNVYAPTGSATATVNIQKTMNGNHPLSGYRFALYETDPTVDAEADVLLTSVPTDAAGTTTMRLTYSAADVGNTYTYYLAEVGRGELINNVQYDDTVYRVEVTVTDNLDGTISAATVITNLPAGANVPTFENEYVPSASDYVTLSGRKTIRGDRVLNANEFAFKIEAVTAGAPMPAETEVKNASNGSFSFGAIEFADAHKGNTYEYTITEVDTNKIGGFTYDATVYTVTVTVNDNGDRTITASTVINNGTANVTDITFENAYDATDAQVTLTGTKMLTGKTMQADEFTFKLTALTAGAPMPASATATNDANGNIAFGTITYAKAGTYVYTIAEVNGGDHLYNYDESVYTVTVTVTDNSVGKLSARVALTKNNMPATAIVFENGFTPAPILYDIHTDFGGEKVLGGRPLEAGEFAFALINALNGEQIGETVKNAADGTFRFPAVTIAAAGVYHFKITEVVGTEKGVSYDTSSFHVRVVVEQDDDGVLSITDKRLYKGTVEKQEVGGVLTEVTNYAQLTGTDAVIRFNNTYKAEPVYVTLGATKVLLGRDLKDGEFKFDLYKTDDTFATENLTPVQDDVTLVLNNDGKGDVTFMAEKFDTVGTYYYVIVEDEADEKGVTADKTAYKVEIEVTDNHQGNLVATLKVNGQAVNGALADTVTFENVYKAAATDIVISGEKTLEGRELGAEEFSFELYDAVGAKVETVKNAANGKFAFTAIPIDTAGEYVYTVRELAEDAENVTYDETVYTVKAVVTDNLDGTFSVAYTYLKGTAAAEGVTFVNIYTAPPAPTPEPTPEPAPKPEIPTVQTGDAAQYGWLAALLFVGGGGMLFSFKKKCKEDENA